MHTVRFDAAGGAIRRELPRVDDRFEAPSDAILAVKVQALRTDAVLAIVVAHFAWELVGLIRRRERANVPAPVNISVKWLKLRLSGSARHAEVQISSRFGSNPAVSTFK